MTVPGKPAFDAEAALVEAAARGGRLRRAGFPSGGDPEFLVRQVQQAAIDAGLGPDLEPRRRPGRGRPPPFE